MLAAEKQASDADSALLAFGPFTFDRPNGLLRHGSREIALPPRALAVLDLLVSRAGAIVPRQEIIDSVWKEAFVTDTSLAEAISVLRQALGDDSQSPTYIQTVHRRGYRFVAAVAAAEAPLSRVERSERPPARDERQSPSIAWHLAPWTLAVLSTMLATIAVWQYTHRREPASPIVRMRLEPVPGTTFDVRAPAFALSPDGLVVAWSACDTGCRLYVRSIDRLDPQPVAGTEDASGPFFSPDGRWIGFFANGKLRKVALAGGTPTVVAEASQPFGAVWLPDGTIVFAASARGGLLRVADRGGQVERLTVPSADAGEVRHAWPSLAPGARALLFSIATSPMGDSPGRIALLPLGTRAAWQTILEDADIAQSASPDYIAFARGNEMHAVAFDRARQAPAGADALMLSGMARDAFAVSRSGSLVYAAAEDGAPATLEWIVSPHSSMSPELAALHTAALTADGSRLAGVGGTDIWVGDVVRGTLTRLTHESTNASPIWDGAGTHVYYAARTTGPFDAWMRDSAAAAAPRRVPAPRDPHHHVVPTSISRDDRLMAYTESGGPTRGDVRVVDLASASPIAAVQTPFDEAGGMLSPDGRLLAYQSDESGRWEIYVLNLANNQRTPVSNAGGTDTMWAADGSTLLYRAGDALMRVAIDASGVARGAPVRVADLDGAEVAGITADNRILIRRPHTAPPRQAVLTLEWARDLRRIVGPPTAALPR